MESKDTWRESFILRLQIQIPDESKLSEQILRGQIVHTLSGKTWRFASLEDLTTIIQSFVASTAQGKASPRDDASKC